MGRVEKTDPRSTDYPLTPALQTTLWATPRTSRGQSFLLSRKDVLLKFLYRDIRLVVSSSLHRLLACLHRPIDARCLTDKGEQVWHDKDFFGQIYSNWSENRARGTKMINFFYGVISTQWKAAVVMRRHDKCRSVFLTPKPPF